MSDKFRANRLRTYYEKLLAAGPGLPDVDYISLFLNIGQLSPTDEIEFARNLFEFGEPPINLNWRALGERSFDYEREVRSVYGRLKSLGRLTEEEAAKEKKIENKERELQAELARRVKDYKKNENEKPSWHPSPPIA